MKPRGDMKPIDARAPRFNQAVIAVALALGFAFDLRWAAPAAGAVLLLSAAGYGPFLLLWRHVIGPRRGAPTEVEDPRPPRFAAAVGAVFETGATIAFAAGSAAAGWALSLVVAFLAGLAAEVEASGMGRPAVFVLDAVDAVDGVDARDPAQLDGLVGFVTELFGP